MAIIFRADGWIITTIKVETTFAAIKSSLRSAHDVTRLYEFC